MKKNFILEYIFKYKTKVVFYEIILVVLAIISAIFSVILGDLFDVAGTTNYQLFNRIIVKLITTFVLILIFTFVVGLIKSNYISKIYAFIKNNFIHKLLSKPMNKFYENEISEYISVLINDINTIQNMYVESLLSINENIIRLIISIIILLKINVISTIIVVLLSILPIALSAVFNKKIGKEANKFAKGKGEYTKKTVELLNGHDFFKINNSEKDVIALHAEINIKASETKRKSFTWIEGLSSIVGISAISITILTLLGGMFLALRGYLTIGQVFAISFISNGISTPLMELSDLIPKLKGGSAIIKRYEEYITENNVDEYKDISKINDNIKLEDVSLKLDRKILDNVDLKIELGKKYLLTGESGSGKSVLLKTILGQYNNYNGNIKIANLEVKDIDEDSIYKNISYIPQENFFFEDSIKNNLTLFDEDISDEQILEVLDFVNMKNKVLSLPNKLETRLNENKSNLSGGEKQRLSIARTLLKLKQILLLDESTSALDNKNYINIENKLTQLQGITIINICHRLQEEIVDKYDKVLVMDNGKII
ncbi:MAG: ABC transporter ATP-binding protein/permease [Vallitalea sp.]|jgi:ATP-binding cassette subfamily C protein|nr:ABC transporter ATP-binding protein/permease [Vallitalea sp.]